MSILIVILDNLAILGVLLFLLYAHVNIVALLYAFIKRAKLYREAKRELKRLLQEREGALEQNAT